MRLDTYAVLYTYSTPEFNAKLDGCRQNVCSSDPNINDPVRRGHGAWKHSSARAGLLPFFEFTHRWLIALGHYLDF